MNLAPRMFFGQPNRVRKRLDRSLSHVHTTRGKRHLRSSRLGRHHHDVAAVSLGCSRVGLVLLARRVVRGCWLVALLGRIVGHGFQTGGSGIPVTGGRKVKIRV